MCYDAGWFTISKTVALVAALVADVRNLPQRVPLIVINILLLALLHAEYHEFMLMSIVLLSAAMPPTNAATMRLYALAMLLSHAFASHFSQYRTAAVASIVIPWVLFEMLMLSRKPGTDKEGIHATRIAIRARAVTLLVIFAMLAYDNRKCLESQFYSLHSTS